MKLVAGADFRAAAVVAGGGDTSERSDKLRCRFGTFFLSLGYERELTLLRAKILGRRINQRLLKRGRLI